VRGEQRGCAFCRKANTAFQGFVGDLVIGEIGFGGIYADRQGQGLEEAEQRAQLVIEYQRVTFAAAGGGQQHRGVDQRVEANQVE